MKRHTIALALAFGAMLSALPLQAQTKAHRVLFAMTSPDEADWQLTLNNIRNLISGMAPETVEIELVAYGPGIAFLKKDGADAAEIQKLESSHIHFIACGNAMRKQHLEASDLVAGSEIVPAGIVEVVKKQEQGWSYIKAGR
jgi:intracellular sulfur oxidation DsrE/DsrF family protein